MGRSDIKQALEGAIEYLGNNPAEAAYSDSPATARLADIEGLKVEVEGPNGASMRTDMPTSVGGTNTTASPGWYLRAAEASCVATLIAMRAALLDVTLTDLEVTVDSESDDRGILAVGDDVPAGPMSTRIAVRIRGSADVPTLREMCHWALVHCPVTDAVRREIPMTIEVDATD